MQVRKITELPSRRQPSIQQNFVYLLHLTREYKEKHVQCKKGSFFATQQDTHKKLTSQQLSALVDPKGSRRNREIERPCNRPTTLALYPLYSPSFSGAAERPEMLCGAGPECGVVARAQQRLEQNARHPSIDHCRGERARRRRGTRRDGYSVPLRLLRPSRVGLGRFRGRTDKDYNGAFLWKGSAPNANFPEPWLLHFVVSLHKMIHYDIPWILKFRFIITPYVSFNLSIQWLRRLIYTVASQTDSLSIVRILSWCVSNT